MGNLGIVTPLNNEEIEIAVDEKRIVLTRKQAERIIPFLVAWVNGSPSKFLQTDNQK
jgi:hypothetical protein